MSQMLNVNFESYKPSSMQFADEVLEIFISGRYSRVETRVGSVDLSMVRGCTHPLYGGRTWGELMPVGPWRTIFGRDYPPGDLERAGGLLIELKRNPEYYLNMDYKTGWSFFRLGEALYIEGGANRTVIGRVFLSLNNLPAVVHGVSVTELAL